MNATSVLFIAALFTFGLEPPPPAYENMPDGTPEVFYFPEMWKPQQPYGNFKLEGRSTSCGPRG